MGRTIYCIEPKGRLSGILTCGGTKNPELDTIRSLAPDLVLACDLRVASERAWLQWAYILRGMVPMDGGCWMLPRIG